LSRIPWQTTVRGLLEVFGFPTGTAIGLAGATQSGKKADRMASVARLRAALLLFGLFCLLLAHRTQAQAEPPAASERGLFDLSVWTAGATGKENTDSFAEAQILSTGVFFGWVIVADAGSSWRRGGLEYGFNLLPAVVQFTPGHIFGGGFEPIVLRWNSSHHHGRLSPFIELAGGALITNSELPLGDTSAFNFTVRAGGGMAVSTTKHQSFDVACRWSHISNANLGDRNPQFNGLQLSVGYHWFK
jgi:hypothetical protein